jgi:hypothetical protein
MSDELHRTEALCGKEIVSISPQALGRDYAAHTEQCPRCAKTLAKMRGKKAVTKALRDADAEKRKRGRR